MKDQEYAGFWIRFAASLIDLVIMIIVLYLPLSFIYDEGYERNHKLIDGFWDLLLRYIAPIVAVIWCWLRYLGTPGKLITNLKVVDEKSGKKLLLKQAIGRYFAYILAILPLGLGLIWIGIDKKKQGLHDKLAGTVVIRRCGQEQINLEKLLINTDKSSHGHDFIQYSKKPNTLIDLFFLKASM